MTTTPRAMREMETSRLPSGSQTVGPFFHYGLLENGDVPLIRGTDAPAGQRIRIEGRVFDGAGDPVNDALLEIWQADGFGQFNTECAEASFDGFGRLHSREDGSFVIDTVLPGRVDGQASHLNLHLFSRGLLNHLFTRIYFEGEPGLDSDPMLTEVPEARRRTLIARRDGSSDGLDRYRFDLHMQGSEETVFFAL
ncbi:protocatechuate 3,4-dioxygenase subunit alpha [Halotalea alkalilenta]|uniref:protocatechuate 3,4-dioxygenase subunit alpha n=1 Tax=Halotalea alkalilenta TaxID=376489 RepID=UPI000694CAAD|nr:protocatechuate 3,4-dioxygenase subunit alpha [Halotalea alkalilenta]